MLANTVSLEINRETGAITLTNPTGADITFSSLTISSAFGAIEPDELTPITGHYDVNGNGAIDANDAWTITSSPGNHLLFSEMTTGDAGTIGSGEADRTCRLTAAGCRRLWRMFSPACCLGNGTVLNAIVSYSGNGGHPYSTQRLGF